MDAAPSSPRRPAARPAPVPGLAEDPHQRRELRRMKSFAASLLAVAAVGFLLASRWEGSPGAPALAGYLRTACEAAMVGGLADWFAVTALFRHPLGLPIPHTAIIPTRKDAIGQSLGDFVGRHFLAEDVVLARLDSAQVARRTGEWLSKPVNAERVTAEAANVVRAGLALLRDEDVQPVVEQVVARRLAEMHLGPPLGRILAQIVLDGGHTGMVDVLAANVHRWLVTNEAAVVDLVAAQAPDWSPRFVDERVAQRIHVELVRISRAVVEDPEHEIRHAVDRYLLRLSDDLRRDLDTNQRLDAFVASLGGQSEVRSALAQVLAAARRTVVDLVEDPTSELRVRARGWVAGWGARVATDERSAAKVDGWLARVAVHVVTSYRGEITRLITDTVDRWDGQETSRRVELQVGRDLQFIRVNGTVVGALVGVIIHAVGSLLT